MTWCEWAFVATGGTVLLVVLGMLGVAWFIQRTFRTQFKRPS